ncbi:MAG: nitrite reductase small subunit [Mycobacterium sp.]|nr:nitrite reductase small subunit [Mycobacterium sp.]MDT5217410.1 nitrite reductase small subunit [Mycobacterium sp.]
MTRMSARAKTIFQLDDLETLALPNDSEWTTACAYDLLMPCRGVGVLMSDGTQVALFRLADGSLGAIGNVDPWSGAAVMSRGIVGDRAGRACVQSPIKKQAFAFDDGTCLDDDAVRVSVYRTRVTAAGDVQVCRT